MSSFTLALPAPRRARRSRLTVALAAATITLLAACGPTTTEEAAEPVSAAPASESAQILDGWVKAVDDGMTGAFGTIENSGDVEITLVGATTSVSPMVELHETVSGSNDSSMMQQKEGGVTIAAGASHELAPGADHIMLMSVAEPLQPGAEVVLVLEFSDGSTLEHAFIVKEFTGANEEYVGDGGMGDMGDDADG